MAWVAWQANDLREAARLALEAFQMDGATDAGETAAHCSVILGLASERRGDTTGARTRHRDALDIARRTDDPRLLALALEGLAAVALRDRDGDAAARLLGAAAVLRQSLGRATGWGFASIVPVDVDGLRVCAAELIGAGPAATAYSEGAADPRSVVATLL